MRIKKASEYTALRPNTLRKYMDEGRIKGRRIGPQKQRVVEKTELNRFMGRDSGEAEVCAIYARVSTGKREDSGKLDGGKSLLLDYFDRKAIM